MAAAQSRNYRSSCLAGSVHVRRRELLCQKLPQADRSPYIERMWQVRLKGNEIGWGVWDDLEQAWEAAGLPEMGWLSSRRA